MWIVVGMASSQTAADKMKQSLEVEGVLVKLRSTNSTKRATIEVLVLESESDLARDVLLENGF